jgi:hypothetical protein
LHPGVALSRAAPGRSTRKEKVNAVKDVTVGFRGFDCPCRLAGHACKDALNKLVARNNSYRTELAASGRVPLQQRQP